VGHALGLQALIFAPTNQALGNTLAALNISSSAITPQNATVLAETIFYHIVPSEWEGGGEGREAGELEGSQGMGHGS
jgi:uncharacterized surface protein with fasciclin (FAS1) repeats